MPATRTATASARCTSTPWRVSGHCSAPGCVRIAASRRRSCQSTSASLSSCTTRAGAEKPCSVPLSLPWSDDVLRHPGSRQEPPFIVYRCELLIGQKKLPSFCFCQIARFPFSREIPNIQIRWQYSPDPRRLVVRGGDDAAPVGAERRAQDAVLVAGQGPQLLAALGIPDPRRPVFRGGDDAAPVGAERRAQDTVLMASQGPQLLAALGIPDPRRLVFRGGDDAAPVGAERRS